MTKARNTANNPVREEPTTPKTVNEAPVPLPESVEADQIEEFILELPPIFDKTLSRAQKRFLSAYAAVGGIREASRKSGISTRWHYFWVENNAYDVAFSKAKAIFNESIDEELIRRGIRGYPKYLSYKGKRGEVVTDYSDTLAVAVARARLPEYRDGNQIALGPAKISIEILQTNQTTVVVPENENDNKNRG